MPTRSSSASIRVSRTNASRLRYSPSPTEPDFSPAITTRPIRRPKASVQEPGQSLPRCAQPPRWNPSWRASPTLRCALSLRLVPGERCGSSATAMTRTWRWVEPKGGRRPTSGPVSMAGPQRSQRSQWRTWRRSPIIFWGSADLDRVTADGSRGRIQRPPRTRRHAPPRRPGPRPTR